MALVKGTGKNLGRGDTVIVNQSGQKTSFLSIVKTMMMRLKELREFRAGFEKSNQRFTCRYDVLNIAGNGIDFFHELTKVINFISIFLFFLRITFSF